MQQRRGIETLTNNNNQKLQIILMQLSSYGLTDGLINEVSDALEEAYQLGNESGYEAGLYDGREEAFHEISQEQI
jgi:flagellar biosynthesis/type III secretory pathway protein FliH